MTELEQRFDNYWYQEAQDKLNALIYPHTNKVKEVVKTAWLNGAYVEKETIPKEVYIVYVTYMGVMEQIYCYKTENQAQKKVLEVIKKWVNQDTVAYYMKCNNLLSEEMDLEQYSEYFSTGEDDVFVDYHKVILEF